MAEAAAGRRDIVVCCDGTNNTLTAGSEDTNVLQLYTHLCRNAAAERVLYYDPGVGTPDTIPPTDLVDWGKRFFERMAGLASGRGVYDNIAEGYLFLMRHWRSNNDRIFCFGFSRGAFTVRCVVGMVNLFGILKPQHQALLPTLVRIYFSLPDEPTTACWKELTRLLHEGTAKEDKAAAETAGHSDAGRRLTRKALADQVRELFTDTTTPPAEVHWIGVWDTVESVGLPGPLSRSNSAAATLRGKRMMNVRHALAFDEHRWTFEPRLYEEPGDIDDGKQTLKQRWFPGVHCDVGGSYREAEAGLPDASLVWMFNEVAGQWGLEPMPEHAYERVRHDALWDTPWWALAGMCLRNMQPVAKVVLPAGSSLPPPPGGHPKQLPLCLFRRKATAPTLYEVPIAVIAGPGSAAASRSVWAEQRAAWPLLSFFVLGLLFYSLAGACLVPQTTKQVFTQLDVWIEALTAPARFATDLLASLSLQGLYARIGWLSWRSVHPGWATLWQIATIFAWGYLLARVASRSFAWLAGARNEQSRAPAWRWLGMAPLTAIGGAAMSLACIDLAIVSVAIGAVLLRPAFVIVAALFLVVALIGVLGCLPLLLVRLWIAVPGVPRFR